MPALILVPLLVSSGAVTAALDQDLFGERTVLETEHDSSRCADSHDHTICTQVLGGRWAAPLAAVRWATPNLGRTHLPPTRGERSRAPLRTTSHPRAPPLG